MVLGNITHFFFYIFLPLTTQNYITFNGKTLVWSEKHNKNLTIKSKMFGENTGRKQMERQSAAETKGSCVWTAYRKQSWVFDSALEGFGNLLVIPETSITRDRCGLFLSAACPESIKLSRTVNVLPQSTILTLKRILNTNISWPRVELSVYELLSAAFKTDSAKPPCFLEVWLCVGTLNVSI